MSKKKVALFDVDEVLKWYKLDSKQGKPSPVGRAYLPSEFIRKRSTVLTIKTIGH